MSISPLRLRLVLAVILLSLMVCMQLLTFMWVSSKKNENFYLRFNIENQKRDSNIRSSSGRELFMTFAQKETTKVTRRLETTTEARPATKTKFQATEVTSKIYSDVFTLPRTSTPTTKPADMENDYYPLVEFSFVWPETKPDLRGERDFFLIVLVNSAARGDKYRARRNAVRKTWANMKSCEQIKYFRNPKLGKLKWNLVFSLGKAGDPAIDKANAGEAKLNNDVLIGDFHDHYLNNVIKVYMTELWVSSMNVRYILKTDDDVYVRVPLVIDWLVTNNYPERFYGGAPYYGFRVDRNPKGKWAISKKYFSEEYFPTFCAGAFYILSTDILDRLFNYVRQRRPFHTDDAYVGIAARDLNITITRIPGLLLEDNMPVYLSGFNDCKLLRAKGYGHSIEPLLMNTVFNRLDSLCNKNITC